MFSVQQFRQHKIIKLDNKKGSIPTSGVSFFSILLDTTETNVSKRVDTFCDFPLGYGSTNQLSACEHEVSANSSIAEMVR